MKFITYFALLLAWFLLCIVLSFCGIDVPDAVFYIGVCVIMVLLQLLEHMEG